MNVNYALADKAVAQRLSVLRERAQTVKADLQSLIDLVTTLDRTFAATSRG
jgi:hypothetical protein